MTLDADCPVCLDDDDDACVYCGEDEYYMALMESDDPFLDTEPSTL